jgi:carbon starvation protein
MQTLAIMLVVFVGYLAMYRLYGHYIGKRIFALSDQNPVPAVELEDGVDYVPTRKEIIFGHHFTSIAGTGPIVGPAIAVIWGWLPALIWVFVGSIVMGAVHDFGTLVISLRNQGKSISEFTAKYINPRTRFFFFFIVFLELWIVISIFGLVIAVIFKMFPSSVLPVWLQIPIAMALGWAVYHRRVNVALWSLGAVVLMYLTVYWGSRLPLTLPALGSLTPVAVWTLILFVYAFIASVLPVTTLLQPRDYINSHQLVVAMALLSLGVIFSAFGGHLELVAPVIRSSPPGAPPLWPFLFITIACGAISGFHSLVASGTTAKQIRRESDSLFVGYGSMLMESALATLVIIAVAAGIGMGLKSGGQVFTGVEAWNHHYASWQAAKGLGSKISAFVMGSANMMETLGLPRMLALTIMGVFIASFAGTTLDTATRIQRYILSEMSPRLFSNRYVATFAALFLAGLLVFSTGADGKGALTLWPLFGAVNQTLAALSLIIITVYLRHRGGFKWLFAGIPALFMTVVSFWATILNQKQFLSDNLLLSVINGIIILAVLWVTVEGAAALIRTKPHEE